MKRNFPLQAKVSCKIEVTSVDEKSGWYYAKCTKCPKEVARENGVYRCGDCKRIIPYPDKRYFNLPSIFFLLKLVEWFTLPRNVKIIQV